MAPVAGHTGFDSARLVRLLATPTTAGLPAARPAVAEQLGNWLGWTGSLALAGALNTPSPADTGPGPAPAAAAAAQAALARLRSEIARLVDDDEVLGLRSPGTDDFPTCRRAYQSLQRSMAARVAALRGELRALLARQGPALARLAAIDAALDEGLAARERHLLSGVPALLQRRLESRAGADAPALAPQLRELLGAELDVRLQAVEGLVQALGPSTNDSP